MNENRWLDKNVYAKIEKNGKKIGATKVDTKRLKHAAWFKYFVVYFVFLPFEANIHSISSQTSFTASDIDDVKNDLDKVNEFIEYLKTVNYSAIE